MRRRRRAGTPAPDRSCGRCARWSGGRSNPRDPVTIRRPGDRQNGAGPDRPACLADRIQAAGLFGDDDTARSAHPVPDRDLAGVDRVEPGERLVDADVLRTLRPQFVDLGMGELEPAGGVRGDHSHAVVLQLGRHHGRIGQRLVGRGQREPGHPVGLRQQPARNAPLGVESGDLSGERAGIPGGVEALQWSDAAASGKGGRPVVLCVHSVRGHGAQPGDDGAVLQALRQPVGHLHCVCHAFTPSTRWSTMAVWNPPKPLPTLSTVFVTWSRALFGT